LRADDAALLWDPPFRPPVLAVSELY